MQVRILTLAALIFALESSSAIAQNRALPPNPKSVSAVGVVDRLLAGREVLGLTPDQVSRLATLSSRLRHERGRLVVTGLDRVPGKSVPRLERANTTATEAFRQASAVLTPEQQTKAPGLLKSSGR